MLFDVENRAKPVLKWAGGKTGLLKEIVPLFPENFARYVEPFLGGGAVAFALKPNVPCLLNDANEELVNLYSIVRDFPGLLFSKLREFEENYSEAFFYEVRRKFFDDRIEKAARTIFLNKACFNGLYRQNQKGEFNVPFGKRVVCPQLCQFENLEKVSLRLALCDIRNDDFETVLNMAGKGDFVYCDPPYDPLNETSSFNSYLKSGFRRPEQQRLKDSCEDAVARGAVVAVSNSSSEFIYSLYQKWDIHRIPARRAINSIGKRRGHIDELLIVMGMK